jgi:Bifunctional DNA primase/polymerase, N-terminal
MTAGRSEPVRLGPGELLGALGELDPGRAAEGYAALGYPVVPMHAPRPGGSCTCPAGHGCAGPGKHPCLAGWRRLASVNPAVVRGWWRRWPNANVALATGAQFDVLDVDGTEGEEALRAVPSLRDPSEHPGPVARTGGRGWHLLYAPTGVGNRVGMLPGVDWRGRGGLVVAPPSRHASGRRYDWIRPLTTELPQVPAGLHARLAPPRAERSSTPPAPVTAASGRAERYARAALIREARAVTIAPEGSCNHTLNRAAFNLGQLAAASLLDPDEVRAVLLEAALARSSDPEAKLHATIDSGLAGGMRKPRRRGRGVA